MKQPGCDYRGKGVCRFTCWAPLIDHLELMIVSPVKRTVPMEKDGEGYWEAVVEKVFPGHRYFYAVDWKSFPDPASHYQPEGVHGPSEVLDHQAFEWEDGEWMSFSPADMIMYELHTGTFTPEGNFHGIAGKLPYLRDLGINAIEIMPVAQFPGSRNWGYDGVYPFAVQESYGGPGGLKYLVNECHKAGIAVILDVVYNHLGPEGNYLEQFAPYFTSRYRTPWGKAMNFDDAYSDDVRNFFIANALFWFREYHVDALRLDAVHAIYDQSAYPFLQELADAVKLYSGQNRNHYLIAESALNDARIIRPSGPCGFGMDCQWSDDFHHALHALLTNEREGYYMDYGRLDHLARSLKDGFAYQGEYSAFRKRKHGNSPGDLPARKFVVFCQNHDQVGNRMQGERLSTLVSFEALKLAAGLTMLSPYIPMLFMGEEYGETRPFQYFVSHGDEVLIHQVREGRRKEFESFRWEGELPDPQDPETFHRCILDWSRPARDPNPYLHRYYRHLLKIRKEHPCFRRPDRDQMELFTDEDKKVIGFRKIKQGEEIYLLANFSRVKREVHFKGSTGRWEILSDSSAEEFGDSGGMNGSHLELPGNVGIKPESVILLGKTSEK